jgi:hypothetical protein
MEAIQMNKKSWGFILLGVGAIILLLSLTADLFGFGGAAGFGYKQIIGTLAGVITIAVGYFLAFRK